MKNECPDVFEGTDMNVFPNEFYYLVILANQYFRENSLEKKYEIGEEFLAIFRQQGAEMREKLPENWNRILTALLKGVTSQMRTIE